MLTENISDDREPIVAGRFYAADKNELKKDLAGLFAECRKPDSHFVTRAIICPHAGYIFSGRVAASAFSSVPKDAEFENIFLIGSSHAMSFKGASVYDTGDYKFPGGKITVNKKIAQELKTGNCVFNFPVTSHLNEHSLEVQLPFIAHHFLKQPMIVPIIIGTHDDAIIRKIAEALEPWFMPDNLFVISSDFSHYPPYDEAVENDKRVADSIVSGDPDTFLETLKSNAKKGISGLATSMCGWTSGLTLLYLSRKWKNLQYRIIDYCNSGDSFYGGREKVVGYYAIALTEK